MKKSILYFAFALLFLSCASNPIELNRNDENLNMIGGKEALLESIQYPEFALLKGIEGVVTLMAYVDTSGSVRECKVVKGNDYLNEAAISALQKQRFYPYIVNGKKRPVRVEIPISFTISKELDILEFDKKQILENAQNYLQGDILTLNTYPAKRSSGKLQDYYSEGITWWPNPSDTSLPYQIREGSINPDAFLEHRDLLLRASEYISGLTAVYLENGNTIYAERALEHVRAWFIDPKTRMQAHMKFAQAIPNRRSGRDVGIYESLALVEIIQSLNYLQDFLNESEKSKLKLWFVEFSEFLVDHSMGMSIRMRNDTYSAAWLLQITAIARYLNDEYFLENCRDYFQQYYFPNLASDKSPIFDLSKNRNFMDNIFINADILALVSHILSDEKFNAWEYKTAYGRRPGDVINVLYSGILNNKLKTEGSYEGRFLSLLLAGKVYDNSRYLELWRDLQIGTGILSNFPLKQAVLWGRGS